MIYPAAFSIHTDLNPIILNCIDLFRAPNPKLGALNGIRQLWANAMPAQLLFVRLGAENSIFPYYSP